MTKSKSEQKRIDALKSIDTSVDEVKPVENIVRIKSSKTERKESHEVRIQSNRNSEAREKVVNGKEQYTYRYTGNVVVSLPKFNVKVKPGEEITLTEVIDNVHFEQVN